MPSAKFISTDGIENTVESDSGNSPMQIAVDAGFDGILADSGGGCTCATCHCYIDTDWESMLAEPDPIEAGMVEHARDRRESSRLSCQIDMNDDLEGTIVYLSVSQF